MAGGALYTGMYSGAFDSDNYYNSDNAALYYNGSESVDHDVALVGWDDNYDRNNFNNTPPGNGAWIIRNSWGPIGEMMATFICLIMILTQVMK